MKFGFALLLLVGYLVLVPVVDRLISKKICKMKLQYAIKINKQCDQIETRAENAAQEILQGMKIAEALPEEECAKFMNKYEELMFQVDKAKHDVKRIRSEFPLEGEMINV